MRSRDQANRSPEARWRAWAGDPTGSTALVRGSPSMEALAPLLLQAGFTRARTGALSTGDSVALLAEGWRPEGRLHLLEHDLQRVPNSRSRSRRGNTRRLDAVVDLDREAFPNTWQLGAAGLSDALAATPSRRFRTHETGGTTVAFAISGIAGRTGYLQRLAIAEANRGQGLGRSLTLDALRWMRRRADRALVNTYEGNEPALGLYRSVGFRDRSPGLVVLSIDL